MVLLEAGAEVNLRTKEGQTPLWCALNEPGPLKRISLPFELVGVITPLADSDIEEAQGKRAVAQLLRAHRAVL